MEDYKRDVCVILCGYENEAKDLLNFNPGFRSRFTHIVKMEEYTVDELLMILTQKLNEKHFTVGEEVKKQLKDIITNYGKEPVLYAIREASTGNAKQPIAYIRTVAMNYSRQKENDEKTEPKRESLEEIGKRIKEETEKARANGESMTPEEMKAKVIEEMKRKGMKIVGNSTPA
jgi:hypothetical protein